MKVDKLVPRAYYKESRDFSYIGRLFELVFNYAKTGSDLVGLSPIDEFNNSNIIDLAALTLGFESKHKYITKDLVYIISSFTELLRDKGTIYAIEKIINLLCTSQGVETSYSVSYKTDESGKEIKTELVIILPTGLKDIILLEDLFEYILPAGVLYTIIFADKAQTDISNKIVAKERVNYALFESIELGNVSSIDNLDNIKENLVYIVLELEPSNWSTNYNDYYKKDIRLNYVKLNCETAPTFESGKFYKLHKQRSTFYTGTVFANNQIQED